ncbi:MAG: hypothetical protein K5984_03850 [Bacteroidales bacterium]|nr:hypothetical protein [Bacteroidales bacterium]
MKNIVVIIFLIVSEFALSGQEVLRSALIRSRASVGQPSLGLPVRADGDIDPAVWFREGQWFGADSLKAAPFWTMTLVGANSDLLSPVINVCRQWAEEKPRKTVDIVWGPYDGGAFVAICKKVSGGLGWKSLGFVIPKDGVDSSRSIYSYSESVNWIENRIGYNLFPKLPAHLQEMIEEMTASELLCSFQEFDIPEIEIPDPEIEYDWQSDYRERQ